MNIFSRATVLTYRDKPVTPARSASSWAPPMCSTGSLRRAGNRLRINGTAHRYAHRFPAVVRALRPRMQDVFEVQDEIARKIAEALRVTLSPQEQAALAARPTENLQAYDLYLRGKSYARRLTRQDLEFALQMFENAVASIPDFALAHAAVANVCAEYHYNFERDASGSSAREAACAGARCSSLTCPRCRSPRRGCCYAPGRNEEAMRSAVHGDRAQA